MKLIVGLGNPGEKYKNTRHNVGFRVVDALVTSNKAKVTRSPDEKLVTCYMLPKTHTILAKPLTFMNNSGEAIKKLITNHPPSQRLSRAGGQSLITDLYVVHDDLDIPLGQFKIQFAKGPKEHKGIQSVEEALGTNEFWRVRVGVDNRDPSDRIPGEEYVLQEWTSQEYEIVNRVIKQVTREIIRWIREE